MTAQVQAVTCAPGVWTKIAEGSTSVLVQLRQVGSAKLVFANALPVGAPTNHYLSLYSTRPFNGAFDDDTTNLYLWPNGGQSLTVEVVSQ